LELAGKVALITGAARGIGRATALVFAREGARVAVNYQRQAGAAEEVVAQIAAGGGEAFAIQGDVSVAEDAGRLVEAVVARWGRLDVLVNNAGTTRDQLLLRMSEREWDEVMNVNLRGAFLVTRAALRPMTRQRWGRVINVTSVSGVMGNAGQTNYAASKAGLIGFTRSLAREMASRNITCNAVAPGLIPTDLTADLPPNVRTSVMQSIPLGRAGEAQEVAELISFLASDRAAYITGQVIHVDGGLFMA